MGKMLVVSFFGSLIGVSMGMFIGSFGKMQEGVRIGLMLGISMVSSFLAGLMNGNMKDIVEKKCSVCEPDQSCITDLRCVLLYQCI